MAVFVLILNLIHYTLFLLCHKVFVKPFVEPLQCLQTADVCYMYSWYCRLWLV